MGGVLEGKGQTLALGAEGSGITKPMNRWLSAILICLALEAVC